MKQMVDIHRIPISSCPLCSSRRLSVKRGNVSDGSREPDQVECAHCGATFDLSEDGEKVRFDHLPSPYAYFGGYLSSWVPVDEAAELGEAIRDNSKSALTYLPKAMKHAWNLRIILDAGGQADSDSIQLEYSWDETPESEDDGRRELKRIREQEDQIHPLLEQMRQEVDQIRLQYSGENEDPKARKALLEPYERSSALAEQALNDADAAKRNIQRWVEAQA